MVFVQITSHFTWLWGETLDYVQSKMASIKASMCINICLGKQFTFYTKLWLSNLPIYYTLHFSDANMCNNQQMLIETIKNFS